MLHCFPDSAARKKGGKNALGFEGALRVHNYLASLPNGKLPCTSGKRARTLHPETGQEEQWRVDFKEMFPNPDTYKAAVALARKLDGGKVNEEYMFPRRLGDKHWEPVHAVFVDAVNLVKYKNGKPQKNSVESAMKKVMPVMRDLAERHAGEWAAIMVGRGKDKVEKFVPVFDPRFLEEKYVTGTRAAVLRVFHQFREALLPPASPDAPGGE